jgi:hypothetical protein
MTTCIPTLNPGTAMGFLTSEERHPSRMEGGKQVLHGHQDTPLSLYSIPSRVTATQMFLNISVSLNYNLLLVIWSERRRWFQNCSAAAASTHISHLGHQCILRYLKQNVSRRAFSNEHSATSPHSLERQLRPNAASRGIREGLFAQNMLDTLYVHTALRAQALSTSSCTRST